ncbi:malate dehydrogenase [Phytophthora idaei]|nr:malate dehydrogenase [Phytophthora idaei]KAG3143890.1 malate dehydrogenase [Phytophthora idaei]KAG3239535.1 malate dehydrogenase [Phytophthora idaei]
MFTRATSLTVATLRRAYSSAPGQQKVAVLGAAGGIGQPMSLLLKDCDHINHLSLFDVVNTPGVAADIGHINTHAKVTGHVGMEQAGEALEGADVVVIPAGVPRKPGMTRDDLFNTNAGIVQSLAAAASKHCPNAMMLIIANPVNSTVPIVAETFKKAGVYDPKRLFGVTTLDVVRAATFVADNQKWNPRDTNVKVIGGHAGTTILPLLSQLKGAKFSDEDIAKLTHRIQFGGDEVVEAKNGTGSATLSMAYAGARFTSRLLDAMNGEKDVIECSYTQNDVTKLPFFSTPVTLGPNGVEKVHHFGELSAVEQANFDEMIVVLEGQIKKGVDFAKNN